MNTSTEPRLQMELMQKNKKHFGIRIEGQWRHVIQSLYNLMKKQWVQMIPPLIPGSIMTSAHSKPKQISTELKRISLKKHQLLERKKMQDMIDELRSDFGLTEKTVSNEICSLDEEVKQLTEREIELQKSLDEILCANERRDKKEVSEPSSPETDPVRPATSSNVFFVEAPPTFPAPKVYLDSENFPSSPCRTQCPECHQFVLTETSTSISSTNWLACCLIACIGGVVGCCLIPFCNKRFKSIEHKCPLCRTSIQNIQKL